MKKGRITLLSFEEDEDNQSNEPEILSKPSKPKTNNTCVTDRKITFDLTQIKDRVTQMDLNEEIILEGDEALLLMNEGDEDSLMELKIKEAKAARRSHLAEDEEETPEEDFIPITTKGEYWLQRDTRESEEQFNGELSGKSRLVREDLFNEVEIDDASGAYTSFIGSDGTKRGLMMTSRMLERDIKSEMYDFDLGDHDNDGNDDQWEQSQVIKGLEKGWNPLVGKEPFLMKQTKLSALFVPPLKPEVFSNNNNFQEQLVPTCTKELETNIAKIVADSQELEKQISEVEREIQESNQKILQFDEADTFFIRYSRFLNENNRELRNLEVEIIHGKRHDESDSNERRKYLIQLHDKWEHFFDNVDEVEFTDLPLILEKFQSLNLIRSNSEQFIENLAELVGLFVRYHFLAMEFDDSVNASIVFEGSGLKNIFDSFEDASSCCCLLEKVLKIIYKEDLEKVKRIVNEIK